MGARRRPSGGDKVIKTIDRQVNCLISRKRVNKLTWELFCIESRPITIVTESDHFPINNHHLTKCGQINGCAIINGVINWIEMER